MPPEGLSGRIFITGGAGFLGRGILRRAKREGWRARFTIYSRDEEKQDRVKQEFGDMVTCILGDVFDRSHLQHHVWEHDIIIHAAAVKFVPDAERNVWECAKVNIDGPRNVAQAAVKANVGQVVGISTDKAVLPVNTYGLTKAMMERLFAESNRWGLTSRFVTVRYGNVVGSTGSIVPLFAKQLKERGFVTVTNPEATRFWLSIEEAIDLILLALGESRNHPGATFVPRCGAMRIGAIAELLTGGDESKVRLVGMRPGEKEHEVLVHYQESNRTHSMGDYFIVQPSSNPTKAEEAWTYSSQNPAFWVKPEDMQKMIMEAEKV